jgi:hypothetical protein
MEVSAVQRKMLWGCFSLILFLALPGPLLWSKPPFEASARVTISMYNDAGVPGRTLREAEDETGRIFREAGIEVKWLNCGTSEASEEPAACQEAVFPTHLHLRIVRRARGLKEGVLGLSFLDEDGSGCQADLFYEPMEQLHNTNNTNLASLLGHVAAHEMGHLLLGTNSHAPAGIMRAHWVGQEVGSVNLGGLYFSNAESQRMRKKLSGQIEMTKLALPHAATH